ncbi:MAG TPA: sulfatase-like hydrolase/transferase [Candidatus Polarisedimenticolaceae bacterium]
MRRGMGTWFPILALAGASAPSCPAPRRIDAPIVIVSIDTLRADHLAAWGGRGVATPALDLLRRESILFERAYTHAPLTLPSHASLFTGLLPADHGVRDNVGYALDAARAPTLAAALRARGYATAGFVSSFVLRRKTGIGDGFDVWDDAIDPSASRLAEASRDGAETVRRALTWLRRRDGRPFLLFVHLYEPHAPYAPPEPFRTRYAGRPYDGEIAYADALVGRLFDALREDGTWDRATIVLLSDHGEGLGEHGEEEHGVFLYRSTLHVPLMVKLPGGERAGTTLARPCGLAEVAPALLGRGDLLDPSSRGRTIVSETAYPRLHFGWSDLTSAIEGDLQAIAAPEPEVYDLTRDPRQEHNLAPGFGAELLAAAHRARSLPERPEPVDGETLAKLASLGYLGGVAAAGPDDADLPDPKHRIGDLAGLRRGWSALAEGRPAEVVADLPPLLARNPRLLDGWELLARALDAVGDVEAARRAWDRAVEISGGAPPITLGAAAANLRQGRIPEARALGEVALAAGIPGSREVLARAAILERRGDEAEALARAAIADDGSRIAPRIVLAEALLAQGKFAEALAETDRLLEVYRALATPDPAALRGAALVRGRAFASLGDADRATAALEQEIELFPDQVAAYAHLAVVRRLAGDAAGAGDVVRRLRSAPSVRAAQEADRLSAMFRRPS